MAALELPCGSPVRCHLSVITPDEKDCSSALFDSPSGIGRRRALPLDAVRNDLKRCAFLERDARRGRS
jgi:hypothetical protein